MKLLDMKGNEVKDIDFGIVEAGQSKEYEFILYNDAEAEVENIKVLISDKEVEIIKIPKKMYAKGKDSLILKWSPSLTLKRGLKTTLKLSLTELYR